MGQHEIAFDEKRDLGMNKRQKLPYHTNGMRFTAYNADDEVIATRDYYSVDAAALPVQERRRAAGADRAQRPEHRPADVREREVLAQRGRDPRPAARDLERDAVVRDARHP
ncbi:hypothetical protein G6F59_016646 [Rhizopus arrhizus]|nr:hypothetical protein G6F59_016646 [Rhizopus arrhizus]